MIHPAEPSKLHTIPLLFEIRQLAHLAESDARLAELVLELQDLDLFTSLAHASILSDIVRLTCCSICLVLNSRSPILV
jgi:hypothetical protein